MAPRIEELLDVLKVPPGKKIDLKKDYDPGFTGKWMNKEEAEETLAEGVQLLAEMQDKLYAQDKYALLMVLQALDAAGKDGTIKHVMSGVNPQGVDVHSFKGPSGEELDHDLPVAQLQGSAPPRAHRHLQPLVLRRGAGRAGASRIPGGPEAPAGAQGQEYLEASLRGDQQLREVPGQQRHHRLEVLPVRLEGCPEGALPGACPDAREELEVLRSRHEGAPALGRLHRRL